MALSLTMSQFGYRDIQDFTALGGFGNDTEARIAFYKLCDLFLGSEARQKPIPTTTSDRSIINLTSKSSTSTFDHHSAIADISRRLKSSLSCVTGDEQSQEQEKRGRKRKHSDTPPWADESLPSLRDIKRAPGSGLAIRIRIADEKSRPSATKKIRLDTSLRKV